MALMPRAAGTCRSRASRTAEPSSNHSERIMRYWAFRAAREALASFSVATLTTSGLTVSTAVVCSDTVVLLRFAIFFGPPLSFCPAWLRIAQLRSILESQRLQVEQHVDLSQTPVASFQDAYAPLGFVALQFPYPLPVNENDET